MKKNLFLCLFLPVLAFSQQYDVLIVNGKIVIDAETVRILTEESGSQAVKRTHQDPIARHERIDTISHFPRRFIRKRNRKNGRWTYSFFFNQINDFLKERFRFT